MLLVAWGMGEWGNGEWGMGNNQTNPITTAALGRMVPTFVDCRPWIAGLGASSWMDIEGQHDFVVIHIQH